MMIFGFSAQHFQFLSKKIVQFWFYKVQIMILGPNFQFKDLKIVKFWV